MKFNNHRVALPDEVLMLPETSHVEFRVVDTGQEVVFLPEDKDRYDSVPASAYSLQNELKEGLKLEKCPTYIRMEKMYGSDVAMRTVSKLQSMIDEHNMRVARAEYARQILTPPAAPASSAAPASPAASAVSE